MSGGVDSAVAALILTEQGYQPAGVTMCLGVKEAEGEKPRCCGPDAIEDARRVCERLGIPHYAIDYANDLEEKVIRPFICWIRPARSGLITWPPAIMPESKKPKRATF